MRRFLVHLGSLAVMTLSAALTNAEELQVIELEGTQIRGIQELPTVSYLVPWQPPVPADIVAPDSVPVSVGNIRPLERGEFRRVISYHQQFLQNQQAKAAEIAPEAVAKEQN